MDVEKKIGCGVVAIWLAIILFIGGCWLGNVVKLVACDWSSTGTWKGEIVHGLGVIVAPASVFTVWSDAD